MRFRVLTIILLLFVGLFPIGPLKISTVQKAHGAAQVVSLVGYANTGWETPDGTVNPTITIPHGELLNLTTSRGDGLSHEFYIDVDGNGQRDYPIDLTADGPGIAPATTTLGYAPPGTYNYYCIFHPQTMHGKFTVLPPPGSNFAITPNWWLSIIVHGSQYSSTPVTVSSLNGFSGNVSLSAPAVPAGITATLSKSIVSVTPLVPGTTILNLTAGPSTPPGKYAVTLDGSDGISVQTASITTLVYVSDFQLSGTQNMPVPLGSSRNDTFTVISNWGFSGDISLATMSSPLGPRAFLNATHVSITPFRFAHVLLTVDTAGIHYGDYNVTILATSGQSISHQLVYDVSAWPSTLATAPGLVIDPLYLTMIGIWLSILAVIVVSALWGRRREKQAPAESRERISDENPV